MSSKETENISSAQQARQVFEIESQAVARLAERLDGDFDRAVEMIYACKGRVIVTGMGKSGIIGRKITSTLASTGTPAVFLHPGEGVHGDLGVITDLDVAIAISYSGETDELIAILPFFKRFGVSLVALSGVKASTLGRAADCFLDISVEKEACPLGITPTASSTATLAMGDAVAMALIRRRNFCREDFALRHPAGNLGRQLLLRVEDLMHMDRDLPLVDTSANLKQAIVEMSRKRLGMTVVLDADERLAGVLTDGDLRRTLERDAVDMNDSVAELMTRTPKTIAPDALAMEALHIMEEYEITSLIVMHAESREVVGVIHIHDILKAGLR